MPSQVTNYQCPSCTGPLHFDSATGKLKCDYCDSRFDVAYIEDYYAKQDAAAQAHHAESQWDTSGLSDQWDGEVAVYACPSCGAELLCEPTTAATACPYCGNPAIVPGQLGGALRPDLVIPFKLDKNAAMAALKAHYRKKPLLPKAFSRQSHLEEVKGVYVPFWLFDGVADAKASYRATRVYTRRSGNTEVTTTEHYHIRRAGSFPFEKVPVDGSSKMPDAYMDSIEPFDYGELKPFSTAYLPGFLADKYDVSADESARRADQRCQNSALEALRNTVAGYMTCVPVDQQVWLRRGKVRYALLPVWLLTTKWRDQTFLFAVNGQTGKLVGDLPVSWGRFFALLTGSAVALAAVITAVRLLAGLW